MTKKRQPAGISSRSDAERRDQRSEELSQCQQSAFITAPKLIPTPDAFPYFYPSFLPFFSFLLLQKVILKVNSQHYYY